AVQDLHAVPAGMRPALHPGTRLHRPADRRLPSGGLLQAEPIRSSRGAARRVLRAGRHAPPLGAAGDAAFSARRQPAAAARGGRRRLGAGEPRALPDARHRAGPIAHRRPRSLATWGAFGAWLQRIVWNMALPGAWNTVVLSQIALVGMGLL